MPTRNSALADTWRVLAGIDAAAWQPLIGKPRDETPEQVMRRYRAAVDALAAEVARQDAADLQPAK